MKILGVSLGTKNGNNDTMCRVALEAAKEKASTGIFPHVRNLFVCRFLFSCNLFYLISHNLLYMSRLIIRKQKETAEAVPFVILHDSIFPIQDFQKL